MPSNDGELSGDDGGDSGLIVVADRMTGLAGQEKLGDHADTLFSPSLPSRDLQGSMSTMITLF